MNERYLRDINRLPMEYPLRALVLVVALCSFPALRAQVLFVDDNDNILENSATMLAALEAAGVDPVVHNVATIGANPTLSEMLNYELVIWYCSGDGVDLGLWDAPADLQDLALAGVPIWFIGTDMLYANYPSVPTTFTTADLPFTVMGVAGYDVQSYGSDGGEGCPQIDAAPALADAFSSAVQWVFTTLWWVDGVTPAPGNVEVIYQMGPEGYALAGSPCMLRKRDEGMDVTSTFFDPALIGTPEHRVRFVQETLAYLGLSTAVGEVPQNDGVRLLSDGPDALWILSDAQVADIQVWATSGKLLRTIPAGGRLPVRIDLTGVAAGSYLLAVRTQQGQRLVRSIVR